MKLDLIYYRNILDVALKIFFDANEDFFIKEDGKYIFSANVSEHRFKTIFCNCISSAFNAIADLVDICKNDIIVVIDECYPINFILNKYVNPIDDEMLNFIEGKPEIKWTLAENDIAFDIELMNSIAIDFFNRCFLEKISMSKAISNKTIFLAHSNLDCYMLFKIVKWAYGKSNCYNLWNSFSGQCFLKSIDDLISQKSQNKTLLNKDYEFKKYAKEVKEHMQLKLNCI